MSIGGSIFFNLRKAAEEKAYRDAFEKAYNELCPKITQLCEKALEYGLQEAIKELPKVIREHYKADIHFAEKMPKKYKIYPSEICEMPSSAIFEDEIILLKDFYITFSLNKTINEVTVRRYINVVMSTGGSMNIWKKFNQLPEVGDKIFILEKHWKDVFPMSYELAGWDVWDSPTPDKIYFICNDDRGTGSQTLDLSEDIMESFDSYWWCYANDIKYIFQGVN